MYHRCRTKLIKTAKRYSQRLQLEKIQSTIQTSPAEKHNTLLAIKVNHFTEVKIA
jgi:hypothetical protein